MRTCHIIMPDNMPIEHIKRQLGEINKLLQHNPNDLVAGARKGSLLTCMGRIEEGFALIDKMEEDALRKRDVQALEVIYRNKGTSLFWQNRYKDAIIYFEKSLEQNPNNADTHFFIGCALNEMQRFEDAIRHFDQAIKLQHPNPDVHCRKAHALSCCNKDMAALKHLKKTLSKYPESEEVFCTMGDIYRKLKKFKMSVRCYKRAIRAEPDSIQAYMSLVELFMTLKKVSPARRYLDKLLTLIPGDPRFLMIRDALRKLETQRR